MALQLRKAQRSRVKLRVGIASPAGGGKTLSSLLMAYGFMKGEYPNLSDTELWNKICVIDSENGSGELYVNKHTNSFTVGEYNVISLDNNFDPNTYISAIKMCEDAGIETIIIDSASHLWMDLLDKQGAAAKRTGNSYTAWRDITPLLTKFVDTMLQSKAHIIATMRSKTEYVQEKDANNRTIVRKVGMSPVMRDSIEYEFSAYFEIDTDHNAYCSKDRTSIYDGKYMIITPEVGIKLVEWTKEAPENIQPQVIAQEKPKFTPATELDIKTIKSEITQLAKEKIESGVNRDILQDIVKKHNGSPNPNAIIDVEVAKAVLEEIKTILS